ncbi:MAG: PaaI family thioesterase [Chloroflexi bacterium]|uniref:PaaI family thioesterase n=1 Tax=Candidatus Chlorohelix allophototropha TaxID=3003348 RepID=A0A8T7M378_9CHLR|nr:PaaI family thioesterase [Chloroflexota bacterium]WJW65524.1 PaaI family thioesterase [Chloroflexota bacterium L227-S17]
MQNAVDFEKMQEMLSEASFTNLYGFKLHKLGEGECTILVPFHSGLERPGGYVAGPVYMAVADVAMWIAIATSTGYDEARMTLTLEMKTNFLTGAKHEDIYCTAKVLKAGRRAIYGVAECVSASGTLLTHHTLTYMRPSKAEIKASSAE